MKGRRSPTQPAIPPPIHLPTPADDRAANVVVFEFPATLVKRWHRNCLAEFVMPMEGVVELVDSKGFRGTVEPVRKADGKVREAVVIEVRAWSLRRPSRPGCWTEITPANIGSNDARMRLRAWAPSRPEGGERATRRECDTVHPTNRDLCPKGHISLRRTPPHGSRQVRGWRLPRSARTTADAGPHGSGPGCRSGPWRIHRASRLTGVKPGPDQRRRLASWAGR